VQTALGVPVEGFLVGGDDVRPQDQAVPGRCRSGGDQVRALTQNLDQDGIGARGYRPIPP